MLSLLWSKEIYFKAEIESFLIFMLINFRTYSLEMEIKTWKNSNKIADISYTFWVKVFSLLILRNLPNHCSSTLTSWGKVIWHIFWGWDQSSVLVLYGLTNSLSISQQKLARPNSQIDIMSPMDEFNQTVESEQEVGYLDILASLMNGKHRYHSYIT